MSKHWRLLTVLGMVAVLSLAPVVPVLGQRLSQRSEGTFPVIVVFNDNAGFETFRGRYLPDERANENRAGWDYLDFGVAGAVQALEASHGFRATHVYSAAVRGFAARLTARQIANLENDSTVAYVEADGPMSIDSQVLPWGIDRVDADISSTRAGDGQGAISNVHVYVIDTGVDANHSDLNVVDHVNFAGGPNRDCHGHGTHVAGTVAARDNAMDVVGVAPGAPVTGVKVLDCNGSGSTSDVIKGVDWVTANAAKPAVANMSLGGGVQQALDDAVIRSADSGVFYSIAAGNSGRDACNYSPARAGVRDGVLTVAATDSSGQEAWFSNYGSCVDLWAPGVNVLSTLLGGGTTTKSGTSMAAPHVGGSGALYLSSAPAATAADAEAALKGTAINITTTTGKGRNSTTNDSKDGRAIMLDNVRNY